MGIPGTSRMWRAAVFGGSGGGLEYVSLVETLSLNSKLPAPNSKRAEDLQAHMVIKPAMRGLEAN